MGTILKIIGVALAVVFVPWAWLVVVLYLLIRYGAKMIKLAIPIALLGILSGITHANPILIGLLFLIAGIVLVVMMVKYWIGKR